MAFDFPSSPTVGQQFTPASGPTYVYNGYGWSTLTGSLNSPAGSLVLISSQTVTSAVAQVDFAAGIDGTYDEYEIHILGARVSADSALNLRISQDGGATWKAGATDYVYQYSSTVAASVNGVTTAMVLGPQIYAGNVTVNANYRIVFSFPNSTALRKFIMGEAVMSNPTTNARTSFGGNYNTDTGAINGIRFKPDNVLNIVAGTFNLYGVNKIGSPAVALLDPASMTIINPRRVNPNLTASNGGLTLMKTTNEANFRCAVSTAEGRSGLKYFELQALGSAVSNMIGAGYAFPTWETASNYPGNNAQAMSFQSNGFWYANAAGTGGFPTWVAGDWLGVCLDTDQGGAGIRNITQNGNWNNVVGGNPGLPYPAAGLLYTFASLTQIKLVVIPCLYTFNSGWNLNFDGPFIGPVPTGAKRWGSGGP